MGSLLLHLSWGPQAVLLYNDGYINIIGHRKHPRSLGKLCKNIWKEVWETAGPFVEQGLRGDSLYTEDFCFYFDRVENGHELKEERYMTVSFCVFWHQ
jgi:hypothetical protein